MADIKNINLENLQRYDENIKKIIPKENELTQAEYDALSPEEQKNGTTYFITDGKGNIVGATNAKEITQSDYNLLSDEDKKNGTIYFIPDGKSSGEDFSSYEIENTSISFEEAIKRDNIQSGEIVSTLFGKIKKFFSDLKTVALTGSYNDLEDTPAVVASITSSATTSQIASAKSVFDAVEDAKAYTDSEVNSLVNGAPSTLATLGELAEAMENNQSVVEALDNAIGKKADKTEIPVVPNIATKIAETSTNEETAGAKATYGLYKNTSEKLTDFNNTLDNITKVTQGDCTISDGISGKATWYKCGRFVQVWFENVRATSGVLKSSSRLVLDVPAPLIKTSHTLCVSGTGDSACVVVDAGYIRLAGLRDIPDPNGLYGTITYISAE